MFRSLVSLAFALATLTTVAPAAPVPPPGEKELIARHWGTTKGNGEFTLNGKQLTIRSNGQPAHGSVHYIDGSTERIPHITRAVTGDFEATVRVIDASTPNDNGRHRDDPETRAGLFLFAGGEAVEVTLSQSGHPDVKREVRLIKWSGPCYSSNLLADAEPGKSTYLRLTRKDKSFTAAYSFDGQKWSEPVDAKPFGFGTPDEVTVGVLIAHNTRQIGASATFDNFTVTRPK